MIAELFGADDRARIDAALAIRFTVFVDEQHVPAEEEVDVHDRGGSAARHALVRDDDGNALAAGRYFPLDHERIQIGRMAVRREHRGHGVGRYLLEALAADARDRGFARAQLNAQDHAVGFYARAGFTPCGATLVECDIVHQPMDRALEA
jgi:predicted GNAT family N-acyltransferase